MISKHEKQQLRDVISETVLILCKSKLFKKFKDEFHIEGLIGITLDQQELMMVSIHEKVGNKSDDLTPSGKKDCEEPQKLKNKSDDLPTLEKKDNHIRQDPDKHGGKKRKPCHDGGPKEKTIKVEKENNPVPENQPPHVFPSDTTSDSLIANKMPLTGDDSLSQYPATTNHLESLQNLYLLSAGYGNMLNFYGSPALPGDMLSNLDKKKGASGQKSTTTKTKTIPNKPSVQESDKVRSIKEEPVESASEPPDLKVQPFPLAHFPMYQPKRSSKSTFNDFQLQPQTASPNAMLSVTGSPQSPHTEAKAKFTFSREEGSPRRSILEHICHSIMHSEGTFVTTRMLGRRTGRKAQVIREVFLKITTPMDDKHHIGQARETSRGILVYYKCPPSMVRPEALAQYDVDMETYRKIYYKDMKTPPSQHTKEIIESQSPYVRAEKGLSTHGFDLPQGLSSTAAPLPYSDIRFPKTMNSEAEKPGVGADYGNMSHWLTSALQAYQGNATVTENDCDITKSKCPRKSADPSKVQIKQEESYTDAESCDSYPDEKPQSEESEPNKPGENFEENPPNLFSEAQEYPIMMKDNENTIVNAVQENPDHISMVSDNDLQIAEEEDHHAKDSDTLTKSNENVQTLNGLNDLQDSHGADVKKEYLCNDREKFGYDGAESRGQDQSLIDASLKVMRGPDSERLERSEELGQECLEDFDGKTDVQPPSGCFSDQTEEYSQPQGSARDLDEKSPLEGLQQFVSGQSSLK